jgi:outer membrane biosynthesis protein TonB
LGGRGRWITEFEGSLVYRVSFRQPGLHRETLSRKTKNLKPKNIKKQKPKTNQNPKTKTQNPKPKPKNQKPKKKTNKQKTKQTSKQQKKTVFSYSGSQPLSQSFRYSGLNKHMLLLLTTNNEDKVSLYKEAPMF